MARMVSLAGFVAICATRPCFCFFLLEITMYSYVYNLSKICACLLLKKILPKESTPSMHRRKETMATNRNKLSNNTKCWQGCRI